jgi:CRP/FNR family transcriptional regulator
MENIITRLKSLNFFNALDETQLLMLSKYCILKTYPKDAVMIYEGDHISNISFLVEGLAKVYKMDKYDNEIFLYHIYKNSLISELSTLNENVITCASNISIDEESIIIDINYNNFREDFIDTNILTTSFLNEIFAKTQKLQCVVNRELVFDSTAKVAHFLSENLEQFNKIKRSQSSLLLHMQPETLSRVLKKLIRQNIINIELKHVTILDMNKLYGLFRGV